MSCKRKLITIFLTAFVTLFLMGSQVHAESNYSNIYDDTKGYIGTPYKWGGTTPDGFDCSGFVNYVYSQYGIDLPRTTAGLYASGEAVRYLEPGDLVFFKTTKKSASHVGIYIGNNKFIHSADAGVTVSNLYSSYWGPKYLGAKRI
jgi:cell wall-associated NlpC family hydrolase